MKYFFASCLAVALNTTSVVTQAAPGTSKSTSWVRRAQVYADRAAANYAKGRFRLAVKNLRAAEALAEKAKDESLAFIRFNIARCFEELGETRKALEAYEAYDDLPDAPHRKKKAFDSMQALRAKLPGEIRVDCEGIAAVLSIEGLVDGADCPYKSEEVPQGTYDILASSPGYLPTRKTVTVEGGRFQAYSLKLVPSGSVSDASSSTGPGPEPWVLLAGGAATAAAGGVMTYLSIDRKESAESLPPGPDRDQSVQELDTFRTASGILYATGGALAAGGLIWLLLHDRQSEGGDGPALSLRPTLEGLEVRF